MGDEPGTLVREAAPADAPAIADIYNHYVTSTIVTFEEAEVSAAEISRRMHQVSAASLPWLVAVLDGRLTGYAYASKWNGRCAYRFSAEVTVYVERDHGRLGIGSMLYSRLFLALRERGIHAALGRIALPNPGSVALHEKFGLEKVAHLKEVGFKFGQWIDVGYWHRLL